MSLPAPAGGLPSFRHGVHPHDHKESTAERPVARFPFVRRYTMPLSQHIGAPSKPLVRAGVAVRRGQPIAEPGSYVSTALHSPVTGRVIEIERHRLPNGAFGPAIVIEADPYDPQRLPQASPVDACALSQREFVAAVQAGGLVGLGGAAFPSHVKYALPEGRRCRRLVINGCECEPFLTCDHRVMIERAEAVLRGTEILLRQLGAEGATIGVEANKPEAIEALRSKLRADQRIDIRPVQVQYPQGAEKILIKALFDVEVPPGKLPLDVEMVVNNVGTMAALADLFERGAPLIERALTVAGPGVERPANLLVPLGTPVIDVLRHCGLRPEVKLVVMGGPMMGQPLSSLEVPVLKGTSGLLAFNHSAEHAREYACLRCGQCLEACAYFLNPSRLARLARARRYDEMEAYHLMDCMECGACTYTCPSGIPIVQLIRVAKGVVRSRQARSA